MTRVQREYSVTGCYHIMLRGNERKDIFLDDHDRYKFLDALTRKKGQTQLMIYAYCLMDNHVHLVLYDAYNKISTIMKGIATSYAMYFNRKYDRVGHVFQDRFRSETVNDDRHLLSVIRYVHNNPINAGIVNNPGQYTWSSYRNYMAPKTESLVDCRFVLGIISNDMQQAVTEFINFSLDYEDNDAIQYVDDIDKSTTARQDFHLDELIEKKWPGLDQSEVLSDKLKRNEIICDIRNSTNLSIRDISTLLGVNHKVVERLIGQRRQVKGG